MLVWDAHQKWCLFLQLIAEKKTSFLAGIPNKWSVLLILSDLYTEQEFRVLGFVLPKLFYLYNNFLAILCIIAYPFASASKSFVHAGWFTKYPPDFLSGISLLFSLFSARFSTDFSVELGKFSAPLEFETKAATKSKIDFTNMVPKILENCSEISYNMTKTYFFLFDFCDKYFLSPSSF